MKYLFQISVLMLLLSCSNEDRLQTLEDRVRDNRHEFDRTQKMVDELLWIERLRGMAYVDKLELVGPPLGEDKNISLGSLHPKYKTGKFRIKAYAFFPAEFDSQTKYPLMVLPHGGVHSNFNTFYIHIVRELIAQGYIVVAPEYRGSTGFGKRFYESIDYGGLENEDVKACRDYMVENYPFVDSERVGIMGWSHGGMITVMNLFAYPDDYVVGFAGVPVSDLIYRLTTKNQRYRDLYYVDYHIGKTIEEDSLEYQRRSPAYNAGKLQTPLLIHTNTSDADVTSDEVMRLISALKRESKDFDYKGFEEVDGGHSFDRLDTRIGKEVRLDIYAHMGQYLQPLNTLTSLDELNKVSYYFNR